MQEVFDNHHMKVKITKEDFDSYIKVEGNGGTHIWVRLLEYDTGNLRVELWHINLAKQHRRKGITTDLIHLWTKLDFIDYACIFGVCTPEMKNLCKKLELAFDELNLTYIIKDYT